MLDFYNGEYDILLCTTIIETGMDISNVNTLIVYDADHLGLVQLYQLRGRVDWTNRAAYAYFTTAKTKSSRKMREKRLQAIKEFTELGSGIKIADAGPRNPRRRQHSRSRAARVYHVCWIRDVLPAAGRINPRA